jgi:hypothetical protein
MDERRETDRRTPRKRGVLTAARIAGLALVLGSSAAYAMDAGPDGGDRLRPLRVPAAGCCSFPMWGPPAPPPMPREALS